MDENYILHKRCNKIIVKITNPINEIEFSKLKSTDCTHNIQVWYNFATCSILSTEELVQVAQKVAELLIKNNINIKLSTSNFQGNKTFCTTLVNSYSSIRTSKKKLLQSLVKNTLRAGVLFGILKILTGIKY